MTKTEIKLHLQNLSTATSVPYALNRVLYLKVSMTIRKLKLLFDMSEKLLLKRFARSIISISRFQTEMDFQHERRYCNFLTVADLLKQTFDIETIITIKHLLQKELEFRRSNF